MKQAIAAIITLAILSGCATTKPNPVVLSQTGDETKTCIRLSHEMDENRAIITGTETASNVQTRRNVIYGITGAFILIPWFFMDLGNAPTVERQAAQSRIDRLQSIYNEKQCAVRGKV